MKVKRINREQPMKFKPVSFQVTLETEAEYQALLALLWMDGTIPNKVGEMRAHLPTNLKAVQTGEISRVMNLIYHAIKDEE